MLEYFKIIIETGHFHMPTFKDLHHLCKPNSFAMKYLFNPAWHSSISGDFTPSGPLHVCLEYFDPLREHILISEDPTKLCNAIIQTYLKLALNSKQDLTSSDIQTINTMQPALDSNIEFSPDSFELRKIESNLNEIKSM